MPQAPPLVKQSVSAASDPTIVWKPPGAAAAQGPLPLPGSAADPLLESESAVCCYPDGDPLEPLVGVQFGSFRVRRKLSEGGMGVVYEAEHPIIDRRAVIKIMHSKLAKDSDLSARFLNEARAVNIIRHPGLVEVFDYGQRPDGTMFYIMEFLEGESLQARLDAMDHPMPEAQVLHLALQIACALSAAHDNGIIHRELNFSKTPTEKTRKSLFGNGQGTYPHEVGGAGFGTFGGNYHQRQFGASNLMFSRVAFL